MTITIALSPEIEHRLAHQAKAQGVEPAAYVQQLLEKQLQSSEPKTTSSKSLPDWFYEEDFDDGTGDEFFQQVDADRESDRKLFPPELKGKTW